MTVPSSVVHQSSNRWKQPHVHLLTNGTDDPNVACARTGILLGHKEERGADTCHSAGEPWRHYAQ